VGVREGLQLGWDDGVVGFAEGCPVGSLTGLRDGEVEGALVGMVEVGCAVGLFVSPGLVGRDVTGAVLGADEGALDVGIEVGACTSKIGAGTLTTTRTSEKEFRPGPANSDAAPNSFA
jgi:hypothetical protein